MYRKEEIEALRKKEKELMMQIACLKGEFEVKCAELKQEYKMQIEPIRIELKEVRKPLYARDTYERNYGIVTEPAPRKTPEELREYNRIKQQEYRAKRKKMMEGTK